MKPLAIFSDLHLHNHAAFAEHVDGLNSRLLNGRDAFMQVAQTLHAAGGTTVLFLGDWHDSRRKIPVEVLDIGATALEEARDRYGTEVIAVVGNHDLSLDERSCSLHGLPFTDIIDKPQVVTIEGRKVNVVPWTDSPDVVKAASKKRCDFMVGHFGIAGSRVGPSDFEIPGKIGLGDLPSDVPVFLGHYHKPQQIPDTKIRYVGSPLQLTWGEANEAKRFLILQGSKIKSVKTKGLPRFMRVTPDGLGRCRPNDFVEIVVQKKAQAERTRNATRKSLPKAHVVIESDRARTDVPRMVLKGNRVAEHIETWIAENTAPEGVSVDECRAVAMRLMEASEQ